MTLNDGSSASAARPVDGARAADVVYVGYPKAASTFVEHYLAGYDDVTIDRDTQRPLYGASMDAFVREEAGPTNRGRIHVSINEKVAESVIFIDHARWRQNMFTPGGWQAVQPYMRIDPHEAARRIKNAYPGAKILIVIREQVDWLHSAYRYFLPRLPAGQRTFADFCATPRGIVYLEAGHFDITIGAYVDSFGAGKVKVLRFEDLVRSRERFASELVGFIGLAPRPLPEGRANEGSSVRVALIRQKFPIVDRLPNGVRRFAGKLVSALPGKSGSLLSRGEIQMLKGVYEVSNERTDRLIASLDR